MLLAQVIIIANIHLTSNALCLCDNVKFTFFVQKLLVVRETAEKAEKIEWITVLCAPIFIANSNFATKIG